MKKWMMILWMGAGMATACGPRADASLKAIAGFPLTTADRPAAATDRDVPTVVGGVAAFDKTVHDFGDVTVSDGPLTCTFTVRNVSDAPIAIYEVLSSCGCTGVTWPREPIAPGKSAAITATYRNEDGPYPFDKYLTVYLSGLRKPVILRLRGVVHDRLRPLAERYPVHFGDLGLKSAEIKVGNLEQGASKTEVVHVANLGGTPLAVSFADLSDGLSLSLLPPVIPAGGTAELHLTVTADRSRWGKNRYYAVPVVAGRREGRIAAWAWTRESFASWSEEAVRHAAQPLFDQSTWDFGAVPSGMVVEAVFTVTNRGQAPFHVYKVDSDTPGLSAEPLPDVSPGAAGALRVRLDTAGMEKGETSVMLTLTTDAPSRPVINLFLAGIVR